MIRSFSRFAGGALLAAAAAAATATYAPPAEAFGWWSWWGGYHRPFKRFSCLRNRARKLQILHSSDNESSFVDPNTLEQKLLGYATVHAGLEDLAAGECIPSLHLTAGDHTIPGPFYQASAEVPRFAEPGLADIAAFNAMSLAANGMGNHEFDGGIEEFATMLREARYPFIAANLDFSDITLAEGTPAIRRGRDARSCRRARGRVVKSCWLNAGSQRVGLIGRAPADFFNVIEDPENTLGGLDFVGGRDPATNQPLVSAVGQVLEQVELLEARGVNRIVLLDHAQDFTADPLSANALRGIDIIVAAGSTGFMAQDEPDGPFSLLRPEDTPEAGYPTVREDSEGSTVLVVNSDQQFRYVGNLIVEFNRRGEIIGFDDRSGPVATNQAGIDALSLELGTTLAAPRRVERIMSALESTPLIEDAFAVIGTTSSELVGQRAEVRSRETNLGRLAADSTLSYTQSEFPALGVDVALKNGGGIRDTIAGPSIIRLSVQAALAFDNDLAIVELTGEQLLAVMENAVSRVPALDGRFPQVAGMTLEYDASQPGVQGAIALAVPSRVQNLTITRNGGSTDVLVAGGVAQGDLSRTFVMATNSFLATGGDGYASLVAAVDLATTSIGEQRILEEYIQGALAGSVDLPEPLAAPRVVRLDLP